jgi:hypothetical protein
MNNFTSANKHTLETLVEAGTKVAFVGYNPATVVGTPEATAVGQGWSQYYREATANLVEVIYTK